MGSRAVRLMLYLPLLILWTLCLVGAKRNFCRDGLSDDRSLCSGGCKFGYGTKRVDRLCKFDTLLPGLRKCEQPPLKGLTRQNYTQSVTCAQCRPRWNGTYCTQENIAKKPPWKMQDGNITIDLRKKPPNATVIDFYTNDHSSRNKLPNCSIEGCEWASGGPSGGPDAPLRMKCTRAPKKKPKQLIIKCAEGIGLSEVKVMVYVCLPFWSGLETGCDQPCHCQDGLDCDPWTGKCPSGKEILQPTTMSSIGPVTYPSPLTTLSPLTTHSVPLSSSSPGSTKPRPETPIASPSTIEPTSVIQVSTVTTLEPQSLTTTPTGTMRTGEGLTVVEDRVTTRVTSGRGVTEPPAVTTETDQGSGTSDPPATEEVTSSALSTLTTRRDEDIDASTAEPTVTSTEPTVTSTERVTSPYSGTSLKTLRPHTTMEPGPTTAQAGGNGEKSEGDEDERKSHGNRVTNQQANIRGGGGSREGEGTDMSMVPVWGTVGAMVVLVAVAMLAALYLKKRGQSGKMETHEDNPCVVDLEMNDRTPPSNDDEEENQYVNTLEPFSATMEPIAVDAFSNHLCYMKKVGGYRREYQELPNGILSPVTASEEVNNGDVKKNRFGDISPYDDSRVILKKEKESDSDYINASYINGFAEAVAYIAAQGPLPETVGDFWHMVWTEGCSRIVMLTNLVEGAKVKCERYWPENKGSDQTFGAYTITNVKVVQKAHFVVRSLKVTKQADEGSAAEASREVEQFHFTAWPDHGVPCPVALVRFWSWVVLHPVKLGGPMVVQCSAGIGRTGTFIALDMLTHQAETTGKVSVFPTVRRLRKQRINMVQTLSQYRFLHQVVQEWLSCRHADIVKDDLLHGSRWKPEEGAPPTSLPPAITQQCAAQFKVLCELRPEMNDNDMFSARMEENTAKNRSPHILPVEESRVCLAKSDDKDSDYINAVFLPSLTTDEGYVVTQLPLEHTVSHFWCMVMDWRVKTIVRFMDAPKDQEVCLFPDQGRKAQHGAISIHTNSRTEVIPGLSLYTLHLSSQEMQSGGQEVSVYCVESQQALSLKATKVFVSLVNILLPLTTAADQPPIVLQCFEGAGLSCVLCVVMMGVESLQEEQRTNPVLLARLLHTAQPQAITTPEQYEFVVRCLLHHARGITEGDTEPAAVGQPGKPEATAVGQQGDPVSTDAELHIYSNV